MKVHELIDILQGYYPDEEVVLANQSGRILQILGIDRELTEKNGNCTLSVDFPAVGNHIVETEAEKLMRERNKIQEKIDAIQAAEEKAKLEAKPKKKKRRLKSTRQQRIIHKNVADRTEEEKLYLEKCRAKKAEKKALKLKK